jgi:hypothetical protein
MKAGCGKTARPVCAADGGEPSMGASSDPTVRKPANKAARSATEPSVKEPAAAESVERRAGTKGNADRQSTHRTQSRVSVSQALERIRQVGSSLLCRLYPRWEKLWGGRRRSWHLHRPYEPMEVAPWPKSMISAEA